MNKAQSLSVDFWSRAAAGYGAAALPEAQASSKSLKLETSGRFYRGLVNVPSAGTLVAQWSSPRPLRVLANGVLIIDENLTWRSYQRQLRLATIIPVQPVLPFELLMIDGQKRRSVGCAAGQSTIAL